MSPVMIDLLINAVGETVLMTAVSGLFSLIAGLPLGLILVMTSPGGIAQHRGINRSLGLIVNSFRSLPFIILLVALIPFTRFLVGTSLGTWAAIVPLSITATPYFARVAEVSLRDVDRGLIDAVRAMGASKLRIVWDVLIPEALPGLLSGFVVTLVTLVALVGASAMAGAIGAGGLGDLAIRYGYQRFETSVMMAVIVVLIVLVCGIQWCGDKIVQKIDRRH
ncbi:ABC transporter permease [Erwinia sp. 1181_3]|uniref:methionine ABC transporter permease n=1 Tax=Erwinia sp. 1181_3 TaxID=2605957 RepID=UPI004059885A